MSRKEQIVLRYETSMECDDEIIHTYRAIDHPLNADNDDHKDIIIHVVSKTIDAPLGFLVTIEELDSDIMEEAHS